MTANRAPPLVLQLNHPNTPQLQQHPVASHRPLHQGGPCHGATPHARPRAPVALRVVGAGAGYTHQHCGVCVAHEGGAERGVRSVLSHACAVRGVAVCGVVQARASGGAVRAPTPRVHQQLRCTLHHAAPAATPSLPSTSFCTRACPISAAKPSSSSTTLCCLTTWRRNARRARRWQRMR